MFYKMYMRFVDFLLLKLWLFPNMLYVDSLQGEVACVFIEITIDPSSTMFLKIRLKYNVLHFNFHSKLCDVLRYLRQAD